MAASRAHYPRAVIVSLIFLAGACSGSSSGGLLSGCSGCITPLHIPYTGPKENNAVSARISGAGFDYINSNWEMLLGQFLDGGTSITVPISCMTENVSVVGNVYICDQSFDQCASGETCPITVNIDSFSIVPDASGSQTQGTLTGALTLDINTTSQGIYVDTATTVPCLGLESPECGITLNDEGQPLSMEIDFTLDGTLDANHPVLTFNVNNIQGITDINSSDLNFNGENTCGDAWCGLANLSFIKSFLVSELEPTLETQITNAIAAERCRTCNQANGDPECPSGATCDSNSVCQEAGGCVPRMLGIEGTIQPGVGALGAYGVPATATLDISAVAGGSVESDALLADAGGGLTLGIIGGADSAKGQPEVEYVDPCVPDLPAPAVQNPTVPNFDVDGAGTGYEIALGVSGYFLNQAAYEAHRSGTMCLGISGDQISLLNTGLLETFLPSLALVAGSPSQSVTPGDAPLLVTIRPLTAPTITLGAGTYDPQTLAPIDPLITLTLNNLDIDMYALIEDRWSRLFSIGVDVTLPLSLIVDGCPTQTITPALGSLNGLITVSAAPSNSEILAEDPSVLQGLIPAVVSLAGPALSSALKPIAIPSISGFTIFVDSLEGIEQNGETYNDIGLFGSLYAAGDTPTCDTVAMQTVASITGLHVPTQAQLHPAPGQRLPLPVVDVAVSTTDPARAAVFDYRIDSGLWSTFIRGPVLNISDPQLLIQGHHTLYVRARPDGHAGVSDPNPVALDVVIDYQPPQVRLTPDSSHNTIRVQSSDNVTGPQALQFAYLLGTDTAATFGPERPIDLKAVNAAGGVVVQVRDEAGNVGVGTYRAPTLVAGAGPVSQGSASSLASNPVAQGATNSGCSSSGEAGFLLPLILLPLWRRRRH